MECQKFLKVSPKLILTQQTFDTSMFQFPSWLPPEHLLDKWHNGYLVLCKYFCLLTVY